MLEESMKERDITEPFETHAFDSLLFAMRNYDSAELGSISDRTQDVVKQLKMRSMVSLAIQDKLRVLKFDIPKFEKHIDNIQHMLSELVDDALRL